MENVDIFAGAEELADKGQAGQAGQDIFAGAPVSAPKSGFWEKAGDIGMGALGGAKAVGDLSLGMLGYVPSLAAGLLLGPIAGRGPSPYTGKEVSGQELVQGFVGEMFSTPPTQVGTPAEGVYNAITEPVGKAFDFLLTPAHKAKEWGEKVYGPEGGWGIGTAVELLTLGLIGKVGKATSAASKASVVKAKRSVEKLRDIYSGKGGEFASKDLEALNKLKSEPWIEPEMAGAIDTLQQHVYTVLDSARELEEGTSRGILSGESFANVKTSEIKSRKAVSPEEFILTESDFAKVPQQPVGEPLIRRTSEPRIDERPVGPQALAQVLPENIKRDLEPRNKVDISEQLGKEVVEPPAPAPAAEPLRSKIEQSREPVQLVQRPTIPAQVPRPVEPSKIPNVARPIPESVAPVAESAVEPTVKLVRPEPLPLSPKAAEWAKRSAAGEVDTTKIPKKYKNEIRNYLDRNFEIERYDQEQAAKSVEPTQRVISQTELERAPEYMTQLEGRLREAARGNDLEKIREGVEKLYQEVAESTGGQAGTGLPGQVDLALDMVGRVRERVIQAQRVARIKEMPKPERKLKQYTAEDIKQTLAMKRELAKQERLATLKDSKTRRVVRVLEEDLTAKLRNIEGSVEGFSPETIEAIERAIDYCRRKKITLEQFAEKYKLDQQVLLGMYKYSEQLDRDKAILSAPGKESFVGKVVKERKGKRYTDPETGQTIQTYKPKVLDFEEATIKELLDVNPKRWGTGTAVHTWDVINDKSPSHTVMDMVYWRAKGNEAREARELKQKLRDVRQLTKGLSVKDRHDLMVEQYSQQRGGQEVVRNMGWQVPEGGLAMTNPRASEAYNKLRAFYDELGERMNQIRVKTGKAPFKWEDFYAPFLTDLASLDYAPLFEGAKKLESMLADHAANVSMRHQKVRTLNKEYRRVIESDPFKVAERYAQMALKYIHHGETVSWVNEMLGEWSESVKVPRVNKFTGEAVVKKDGSPDYKVYRRLGDANPKLANWIASWNDRVAGKPLKTNVPPEVTRVLRQLSRNAAISLMAGTISSYLNQIGAVANSFTVLRHYMPTGIFDLIESTLPGSKKHSFMMENSEVMPQRYGNLDVTYSDTTRGTNQPFKVYSKAQQAVAKPLMTPIALIDFPTAAATWHGAYRKGMHELGHDIKRAVRYADDVVVRTQASSMKSDIAPIQQHPIGAVVTTLQTFALGQWDFLARDVLGFKNPKIKTAERMKRVMSFLVGTALLSSFFEDVLGINSPVPNPIGEAKRAIENGESPIEVAKETALELLEPLPTFGPVIKYRSEFGGPVVDSILKILNPRDWGDAAEGVSRLAGVPGANQIKKSYRAVKGGMDPMDVVTGGKFPYGTYYKRKKRSKPSF
jgi:hypothetical protein